MRNFATGLFAGAVLGLGVSLLTCNHNCDDFRGIKRRTNCTVRNLGRALHHWCH